MGREDGRLRAALPPHERARDVADHLGAGTIISMRTIIASVTMFTSITSITIMLTISITITGLGSPDSGPTRDRRWYRPKGLIGTQTIIPAPDFRIFPGGRKHRNTQDNEE